MMTMESYIISIRGFGSNPLLALGVIFGASSTISNVEPKTANGKVITEADKMLRREFKLRPKQFVTMLKEVAVA